jgi:glutamate-1-semialdehyde 2,1-aminomutase
MSSTMTELENEVYTTFRAMTPKSFEWYERASQSLVGGVSGTVRYFAPHPLYFSGGQGSQATDIDGNDYIDCFLCGATLLLGHRPPVIESALADSAGGGALVLNPTLATEVAEQLQKMIPAAEKVRLVNSGTEAVMTALRFARAFTGRSKIVKFFGTYHGMGDQLLVGLDGRGKRLGAGIPEEVVSTILMAPFDDLDALKQHLASNDVAAVLVDPSMHHGGLWVGEPDHYRAIKAAAHDAGALLIFDEVISGFRIAAGGAQEYFDVTPDLAVFAKAFGAGEKLGAIVGRADVMGVADPSDRRTAGPFAFQSGTCSDSANAQVSALAAMREYERLGADGEYDAIDARAKRLGVGLQAAFAAHDIACQFTQLGPIVRLFLAEGPLDYDHASRLAHKPIDLFHLGMITEHILTIPGSNDFFLSFAHSDEDIDTIIAAAHRVLDRYDFAGAVSQ